MSVANKDSTRLTATTGDIATSLPARAARSALLAVLLALLAGLSAKTVSSAFTSTAMFTYPFQFDESEGMIVAETMLLDRGVNIYERPTGDLFVAAPYPPLFYLLDWPLQHVAGVEPTFKGGRAISILATLFAGLAIFGIVAAATRDRLAAILAAATWGSLGVVTFWGSLVKPDMLALGLGLAGMWWLLARPPAQVWWALPFFVAAFLTKQTAIAAAVAGTGWLLFTRPRTGVAFGGLYAMSVALPSLLLNWLTDGGYGYHEYTLHDLPWSLPRFQEYLGNLIATYGAFLLPGIVGTLVGAGLWLALRFDKYPQVLRNNAGLLLLFYLLMTLITASGAGTLGGNHNHLLDLTAACCIGLGTGAAMSRLARLWQVRLALAFAGALMLTQVPGLFTTPEWLKSEFSLLLDSKREGMTNIFQYVTNNGGPAYSDNVGLMLTTRKQLWTTDPYTQTHATFYHRWDESKLVEAIRSKHFSQVILRIDIAHPDAGAGDVSPGILQALRDNYKLDQRNVENIYVPR